jgi:hypothetical protein
MLHSTITKHDRKENKLIVLEMIKTDLLFIYALTIFHLHLLHEKFSMLTQILRTTQNWWNALAVRLGIVESAYVRIRNTSISFRVAKGNWRDYLNVIRICLNRKIRYLGGDTFGTSHVGGLARANLLCR